MECLTGLDPHSGYMNEEVWQEMQMDTQGKVWWSRNRNYNGRGFCKSYFTNRR